MIAMYRLLNIVVTACLFGFVFSQCQNHWIYHGHSCFYFSSYQTDWYQASGKCREHNSVLALIQSQDVSDWIDTKIKGHNVAYYVGASDEFVEGTWEWAFSGEPVTLSNWASGQGQGTNADANCLVIFNKDPNVRGTWYDEKCTHLYNFICQQSASVPVVG
ncbi:C-type lectin domain family 4 member E-like isoform X4 [Mytilus edulis]|uniref:C-type lectin domain family 4 member E-like isoform X4 n=1 Tax=Mytilus edulis TaxID=6550 RepID=UPI0039F11C78